METMILVVTVAFTAGGLCGVALGVAIGLTGKEGKDNEQGKT